MVLRCGGNPFSPRHYRTEEWQHRWSEWQCSIELVVVSSREGGIQLHKALEVASRQILFAAFTMSTPAADATITRPSWAYLLETFQALDRHIVQATDDLNGRAVVADIFHSLHEGLVRREHLHPLLGIEHAHGRADTLARPMNFLTIRARSFGVFSSRMHHVVQRAILLK